MNINSSLKQFLIGNQYVGIEYFSLRDEEKLTIIDIQRKKGELVSTKEDVRIFKDSVFKSLDKKKAYCLVLNSNQVLQKEILETEGTDSKLLHKAYPNIKWEDFYYTIWRLKSKSIISIARKSFVDDLINIFKVNEIALFHISLGNSSLSIIDAIVAHEVLETNRHDLNFDEDKDFIIARDKKSSIHHDINGLSIPNTHLLAFSVILESILKRKLTTGNIVELNTTLQDNYLQKQFFSKGMQTGIGTLLGILLLNFFAFTHYYKKVEDNAQILQLNQSSQETIVKLIDSIKLKEDAVTKIYGNNQKLTSVLFNRLTRDIPASILLSELVYQPLEKKIKSGEPILIEDRVVLINGTSHNTNDFTNWLETIENTDFVDKVIITQFGKNDKSETIFSLKVLINATK